MSILWPSASRANDLLQGVRLEFDTQSQASNVTRVKRHVDDAFGQEKNSDYLEREAFRAGGEGEQQQQELARASGEPGVQDLSTRIMAHMLGLDIPGIEPSTSYYPGYQWWPTPRQAQGQPAPPMLQSQMTQHPSYSQVSNVQRRPSGDFNNVYSGPGPVAGWAPVPESGGIMNVSNPAPDYNYTYNFNQYGL